MNTEQLTPWSDVFRASSLGSNVYYAKHQRSVFRIATTSFEERDIPSHVKISLFSPTKRDAAFLDGGVVERDPVNFSDLRGAWVIGTEALRYLCDLMGLTQPRKLRAEPQVPTIDAIHDHLRFQLDNEVAGLERRLRRFANVADGMDLDSVAGELGPVEGHE